MKKTTPQSTPQISQRINLFFLFLLFAGFAFAQQGTFKGKVFDEYNFPLMDVTVTDGTNTTHSDGDGNFSLEVPANADVQVRFEQTGRITFIETVNVASGQTYER